MKTGYTRKRGSKIMVCATGLLFFSIAVFSQDRPPSPDGKLSFDVAEAADNLPLPGVYVYVHNAYAYKLKKPGAQRDQTVELDAKGRAEIMLHPGLYDIFISVAGFSPKCRVVEVVPNQTTPIIERMLVDEEHQQQ